MGTRLSNDIIAVLSHSGGVISLPPSLLTLGGRQYRTSTLTRTIATDVTMTANSLYFVYVLLVSGVPAIRISATVPSVYLAANPTAKIVSAFYANGLGSVAFGGFIKDIGGTPETESIDVLPVIAGGGATNYVITGYWSRVGDRLLGKIGLQFTGVPAAFTFMTLAEFSNLPIDILKTKGATVANASNAIVEIGRASFHDIGNQYFIGGVIYTGALNVFHLGNIPPIAYQNVTNTAPFSPVAGDYYSMELNYVVSGWLKTPIKDL